jgi:hypothetical protein
MEQIDAQGFYYTRSVTNPRSGLDALDKAYHSSGAIVTRSPFI